MYNEEDNTVQEPADYKPTKPERITRRRIYDRYLDMRGDTNRIEAEGEWEDGDSMFGQYIPPPDTDDWRAHLVLPDAFAGVQTHMQETIDRRSRPLLRRTEDSDRAREAFTNAILTHNMNYTGFDFQYFLAKYSASIRGTAYLVEKYRVDKREINDPTGVNADGTLQYTKKEITDLDDTVTEWIANEFVYIDPSAQHIDLARDCIIREVIDIDEFKRVYGFRKDCINVDKVRPGGETTTKSFFKFPKDMRERDVEVLHYYNRATDLYEIAANNVVVRQGFIPFKHKELPIVPIYHYMMPGRMYGLGVPKVIKALSEERASIRNLNLDRQKMQINKMFLINDQADFEEDDLVVRPHGFVEVATNGLSIRDTVQPLEYGDVPASYFRTEEILIEDIHRATGVDDRIQGNPVGGTAAEAAILKETSQKRINLIATIAEMDAMRRLGRLKWSNIQFFYPAPKVEKITEDNQEREEKIYRKISVEGREFTIVKGANGNELQVNDIEGTTSFALNKSFARYMSGDYDVTVDAESATIISKPIQQAKITEMLTLIANNPLFLSQLDPRKTLSRYLEVNQEMPNSWMKDAGRSDDEQRTVADWENQVMKSGVVLAATKDATEVHTEEHLNFTNSQEYHQLPEGIQLIFQQHITAEHDANPATNSTAEAMGGLPNTPGGPGAPPPTGPGPQGPPPAIAPVDLTPSTVVGEAPN